MAKENKKRFPLYVVKRIGNSNRKIWLIRVIGIVVAFLFSGIICSAFKPGSFLTYYENMFIGCFDPTDFSTLIDLLLLIAIYFMMTLAITPAFKMKFWNIGGEGQTLIACLATAGILKFAPHSWPTWLALIVSLVGALIAGAIWAVVPAIFKAFFNTNETLFTLMMNYIATGLVSLCISIWITNGSQVFGLLPMDRQIPSIADIDYLIPIIVIALVSVVVILYLKKNKGGYEISVVGSSTNTARYVGINVKKVIIRTMIISGLISGLVGYLITAGVNFTVSTDVVGGKGFTSVLIAWLGHFEPLEMLLYAGLVAIFEQGSIKAATTLNMSSKNFSAIVTGTFFFVIIACEFFANYEIKIHRGMGDDRSKYTFLGISLVSKKWRKAYKNCNVGDNFSKVIEIAGKPTQTLSINNSIVYTYVSTEWKGIFRRGSIERKMQFVVENDIIVSKTSQNLVSFAV